ncbi:HU family DNA-binding protein [Novosphingobium sp.]|uniref:HU family DNA-binding protein n=1 Tax=Novosphingobium sp. TaxID=1874826 RepID=UPI002734D6AA|nr:HU family DNA-binding protein [Novosphingobium sp.]MDP3907535.1 HU family DNA-binding protein [Novosphingobium sp.]
MNTSDIADQLAETNGLTKAEARKLVDGVFAAIADAAAKGDEVAINGFGKFKVKASPAREGRNPATGETITIAASKKLTLTVAKAVKDRLNG